MPRDFLMVIDESHATVPQIGGMHAGDLSRKQVLVEHGFRLPSALDNRPLSFPEFQSLQQQTIYASATPGPQELGWSGGQVAELIVRPTGLLDPKVTLKPLKGQIDDLIEEARRRVDRHERVLVTTLTKRTAEELTEYLRDIGINVRYLHSEIDAIERVEILDHAKDSIRLGRLKSGGPLLIDHDNSIRSQIGVIESVEIGADRVGRAVVRFGKDADSDAIFQKVKDGIVGNVSVGYLIHQAKLVESKNDVDTYRVTDWEPLEISLVTGSAEGQRDSFGSPTYGPSRLRRK